MGSLGLLVVVAVAAVVLELTAADSWNGGRATFSGTMGEHHIIDPSSIH
jgi:hypothetical protein